MVEGSKLVVKVVSARNLTNKDEPNSSSAFVQAVFNGQRKTTRSVTGDLNPFWNETMEFPVTDFDDMTNDILEVDVFDNSRRSSGKKAKFLGRVGLHGGTFPRKGEEQLIFYRLEKTGLFSLTRRELGLIIYYTHESDDKSGLHDNRGLSRELSSPLHLQKKSSGGQKVTPRPGGQTTPQEISLPGKKAPENPRRNKLNEQRSVGVSSTKRTGAAETGIAKEEPIVHKGSRLTEKMGLLREVRMESEKQATTCEHGEKMATNSSDSNHLQLSPVHNSAQTVVQCQNGTPSSWPPPSRRPPPISLDVRPPDSQASEGVPQPALSSTFSDQHSDSHESCVSCDENLPNPSKEEPEPAETKEDLLSALLQGNETLLQTIQRQSSTGNLIEQGATDTLADKIKSPQNRVAVEEEVSLASSVMPSEVVHPTGDATDLQPIVDMLHSAPSQDKLHFYMKPTTRTTTEGFLRMDTACKSEEVLINGPDDSSASEHLEPALDDQQTPSSGLTEDIQYLFVRVVKARTFLAGVKSNPNSYVYLQLGDQHAKTEVISESTHPEWNKIFAFKFYIDAGTLEVSVWDQTPSPSQNNFLGAIFFDLVEIPKRVSPNKPVAPQWYSLEPKNGTIDAVAGEVMLSLWIGMQSDEVLPDAMHSETRNHNSSTRSKIYLSPKLWYLRLNVIEAQDLQTPSTPQRLPEVSVKVQLGFQIARTRVAKRRSISPFWNEDLLLVVSEPFDGEVLISVDDHRGAHAYDVIGTLQIPLDQVQKRIDDRQVASRWFNLNCTWDSNEPTARFQGRIQLRICLEGGYHVMDEAAHLSSDLRPSAKQLWNPPIGVLELGILGAQNLLPIKNKEGNGTTDAYCVAKYGPKWVRTRTVLDSLSPCWNEQFTWEVYDPCTVLTLCVFDNGELEHTLQRPRRTTVHTRMGKIRVRLSTLEADRAYTISYPLFVLQPGAGLKKMGDMEVALRFSCISVFSLLNTYTKPQLPRMHYLHPLSMQQQEALRTAAMKLAATRLSQNELPLKPEVVLYILDADSTLWSMRRSRVNWLRISNTMGGVYATMSWMSDICQWRNPVTTLLVHVLFMILLCYPELILPTIFFYMCLIGIWQFRSRGLSPPHIDPSLSQADTIDHDDLDEEFDSQPTSKPAHIVKIRYERLRGIAGRIQMVLGDIAAHSERMHGLLTWRDTRATSIFVFFCFFMAVWLYIAPFRLAALLVGIHFLRHPRFRDPLPSTVANFFQRLPTQSDRIL